jgi:hypothetical protein
MDEKKIEKRSIFRSKNGAEISQKMCAFFKKYTIPEMLEKDKINGVSPAYTTKPDILSIFDGGLPLTQPDPYPAR